MKRIIVSVGIALCLAMMGIVHAAPRELCDVSTQQTADATILTGGGYFHGIAVVTDGTNSVTVNVYDNTAGSGTKLIPDWVVTSSSANRAQTYSVYPPIRVTTGIYVDITTAGSVKYMVYYEK